MGASYSLLLERGESLRRPLWMSLGLHVALVVVALVYGLLGPRGTRLDWGEKGAGTGGGPDVAKVNAVGSVPGIPLPTPAMTTPSAIANESPGLHQDEPPPKPQEEETTTELPKFKDAIPPKRAINIAKHLNKNLPPPPPNAIPYGMGGAPANNYSEFQTAGGGGGGLGFGNPDFGSRYAWYVQALRNRISSNWLMSTVSPGIMSAPRVYIAFDILRDGTIAHVQLIQSSGIPEVDRSALRAVLASSPMNALPNDYRDNMVSVKFYFDFRRTQ